MPEIGSSKPSVISAILTAIQHYGPLQSEEAIQYAREIFEFVRAQMA